MAQSILAEFGGRVLKKKAWNVDLKLVLNWANYLFAEHASDSSTNCNSFLN